MRRTVILVLLVLISRGIRSQESFYDKMMNLNMAIADTSGDWMALERSAGVFDRLSRGMSGDWTGNYYKALCYVRVADILIKKDSAYARSRTVLAKQNLRMYDSVLKNSDEGKVLKVYLEVVTLKLNKPNEKQLQKLEQDILKVKKDFPKNPRIHVIHAYYLSGFNAANKTVLPKINDCINRANTLFEKEVPQGYVPRWGKKWATDIEASVKTARKTK